MVSYKCHFVSSQQDGGSVDGGGILLTPNAVRTFVRQAQGKVNMKRRNQRGVSRRIHCRSILKVQPRYNGRFLELGSGAVKHDFVK